MGNKLTTILSMSNPVIFLQVSIKRHFNHPSDGSHIGHATRQCHHFPSQRGSTGNDSLLVRLLLTLTQERYQDPKIRRFLIPSSKEFEDES